MRSFDFRDSARNAMEKIPEMTTTLMRMSSFHTGTREQKARFRMVRRRRKTVLMKSTGERDEMMRLIFMKGKSEFQRKSCGIGFQENRQPDKIRRGYLFGALLKIKRDLVELFVRKSHHS